jgi:hypothetical protein
MRLNGWQRIGIITSVVWAIGAPIYLDYSAEQKAMEWFRASYEVCRSNPGNDGNTCFEMASRAYDNVSRYRSFADTGNVAFVSLVPIVLGWLLAYARLPRGLDTGWLHPSAQVVMLWDAGPHRSAPPWRGI